MDRVFLTYRFYPCFSCLDLGVALLQMKNFEADLLCSADPLQDHELY